MQLFILLFACAAMICPQPAQQVRLFHIERSKNANTVCYDAQLDESGSFDLTAPVSVYWLMKAEDGRREDLSWLEKKRAYGYSFEKLEEKISLKLQACNARDITLSMTKDGPKAEMIIAGKPAYLQKIYIRTSDGIFAPSVNYAELFGIDVSTGKPAYEKIIP